MKLVPHPQTPPAVALTVEAEARRAGGRLAFEFVVCGPCDTLRRAPAGPPLRTDGLWTTTCFEAFLRVPGEAAYVELNFAPSTRWAAYRFSAMREGMAPFAIETPRIVARCSAGRFSLSAEVDASAFAGGTLQAAMTAVLEDKSGLKSYWSLRHGAGRPDFHAAEGYVCDIAPDVGAQNGE